MTTRISELSRLLTGALIILLLSACGLTAPRGNDGYAELDSLGVFDTDRVMSLSLGPTVLHFAARMTDEEDPEIAALLKGLDGVRIRIYEIDGDVERVARRIEAMSNHLQADHWEPVMLVREEGEQVHMLMRMSNDHIQGLTLITSDGTSEAVVINLMGELDPRHFDDVMVALDVDAPEVRVASVN
jgi:hypothetical protein